MSNNGLAVEIGKFIGSFDVTDATIEKIEKLEDYIREANTIANMKTGETLVVDAIYDEMMDILRQVNPESPILQELWELGDENNIEGNQYTELLVANPMKSILTVKSFDSQEMREFQSNFHNEPTTLHMSLKLNGWGTRIVYQDREFVAGSSRARSTAGRDLTRQLGIILERLGLLELPDSFPDGLVEIRGEMVLPFSNLELARQYNPNIVSAFSGVASMARDSATDEEISLLHFVAYKLIIDGMEFDSITDMYNMLEEEAGFETPLYWLIDDVSQDELVDVLESTLEEITEMVFDEDEPYDYFTDGVIGQVNDFDVYHAMGENGAKYDFGNIALKVGNWKQDNYFGYVQFIEYSKGKAKLSPVAIISTEPNHATFVLDEDEGHFQGLDELMEYHDISDGSISPMECLTNYNELGVITASGNKVRRVPLYEPVNLIRLNIKPNSIIHFKYGGEAGVVPCREDGSLLKDTTVGVDYIDTMFE